MGSVDGTQVITYVANTFTCSAILPALLFDFLFIFMCMGASLLHGSLLHGSLHHVMQFPWRPEEGTRSPGTLSAACLRWVLGMESGFSRRAASVLNY